MKLVWKISALLLTLIALPVYAATGAAELTDLLGKMKTMQAKFTQTVFDNNGKVGVKSYGSMALDRPGKFRWSVEKPMPQVVIANGDKLWIYDPDLMQVTIRSLKTEAGEAPALLLSHQNTTLETNYSIETMTDQKALRWFLLKPKQNDNMFASVKMGFDPKHQLKEMVLEDQIGHVTRVEFANIEMNKSLSAGLFTFKAPKGTDVIDETKKSA
jgi:outer membrane lipoprotein carrier protein